MPDFFYNCFNMYSNLFINVIDKCARNFPKKFLDIRKGYLLYIIGPKHMSTF